MCAQPVSAPKSTFLLPAGKLPPDLLAALFAELPTEHPQLVLGPGVGEDAAVVDFAPGDARLLVAKSDPITFATDEIGFYAVNVCANDLAVTGATPRFYLPTLLLPAGATDTDLATTIFAQIGAACRRLNVVVAGGHSEITHAVTQPVVAGTMLGDVPRSRFVHSGGARVGDVVLLAGAVPVEGASIIAREKRDELLALGWDAADVDHAAELLHDPGISVLTPALAAAQAGLVSAMHDPTEGGVITGLHELATAADVGLAIDLEAIDLLPVAAELCATFGLNPLGVIASGALLATCAPDDAAALQQLWSSHGWTSRVIGTVTPVEAGLRASRGGEPTRFPHFAVDEITKLFA